MAKSIASPSEDNSLSVHWYNRVTKFVSVLLNAGLTTWHMQRVISRPALARRIIQFIEADAEPRWVPASTDLVLPIDPKRLDKLSAVLRWRYDIGAVLDFVSADLAGKVTYDQLADELLRFAPLRLRYGFTADGVVTVQQLADWLCLSTTTIRNELNRRLNQLHRDLEMLKSVSQRDAWLLEHFGIQPEQAPLTPLDPSTPIEELFSEARTLDCLRREKILTLGDLLAKSEMDLLDVRNLGASRIDDIIAKLAESGLRLQPSSPGFDPSTVEFDADDSE